MKNFIFKSSWSFILIFLTTFNITAQQVTKAKANGNWNSANTWDNGVPNANKRAIISKNFRVNIVGSHTAKEVVVHGTLNVNENGNLNKALTTRWVHVNSGGVFRIGQANNRFDRGNFTLTLTGTDPNANQSVPMANGMNMDIKKNDGFLMAGGGGRLQFFGENRLPFTKLSQTAAIGARTITVANIIDRNHSGALSAQHDGVLNWEVGDQIVIASSATDYTREDVRTITAIQNLGANTRLTLDRPLTYMHYGEIETYGKDLDPQSINPGKTFSIDLRAEVALLSRNIKIKGTEAQDTDNFFGDRAKLVKEGKGKAKNGVGGHIMIMPSAGQISVEGVQLDLMGQAGRLGRYPFHWHVARDRSGDYFRNSSITNSNNRGVVVHTTDNVVVEGIVLHDVHGHGFFTEDGVELNNKFINNIAYGIHRVHPDDNRPGAAAYVVDETDTFHDRTDRSRTTSAFWIANAGNDYIGNVVAGCEGSGIWFGQPALPRGAAGKIAEYANFRPRETPLANFDHNTVHSSVTGFVVALRGNAPDGGGAFGEKERTFGNIDPVYKNLTIYLTRIGLYPLVSNVRHTFTNFKAADNNFFSWDSDPNLIKDALLVIRSRGNLNERNKEVTGLALYHGNTIIENAHIAGVGGRFFVAQGGGNRVRSGAETEGLSYENDGSYSKMNAAQRANHLSIRDVYDRDGTLTSRFGGGPGYSFAPLDPWTFDSSLGDKRTGSTNDQFKSIVTKQRYVNLETPTSSNPTRENKRPKVTITSPQGVTIDFKKRNEFNQRRVGLKAGAEYTLRFPEGFNIDTQDMLLSLHQWSMPSNTVGVILKLVDQANNIKPRNYQTKQVFSKLNSLGALRNSKVDSYFRAGNNDLYLKLMNRGESIHGNWIHFVKADPGPSQNTKPVVSFVSPSNKNLNIGDNLYVKANARDADGTINNVKLYVNGTLVRQENITPYEWGASGQDDLLLQNLSAGSYTLRIVATDNDGATSEATLTISVVDPNSDQVVLFDGCNYSGTSANFSEGTFAFREFTSKFPNDKLSSIRVPSGYKVTLYLHGGPSGRTLVLTRDDGCLDNNNFNNITSAIKVERQVRVFGGCAFSGTSASFGEGTFEFKEFTAKFPNDRLSSLSVPNGYKVTLYEHGGLSGRTREFIADDDCLQDNRFNDLASAIKVEKIGTTRDNNDVLNASISMYPNPTEGLLYFENVPLESTGFVYSLNGKKVMDFIVDENYLIDISGLAKGIYFVNIIDSESLQEIFAKVYKE
ncbi:G8 domain-containing protein [Aquimarina sp. RZ0]|uniref:G8 domain-containing protein n=1 Tax=Aquimarina sp. RZ0 TaxID=2607730 RepID=UPI0011F25A74|nr:G8 domain-containing protein [Aquimarina sp. RZ0]KAA1246639.1 T9SS type A sorting domain-containing protein [Aquimarina sp. RZ0]